MADNMSQLRHKMFQELNLPVNEADIRKLKRKQRIKIVLWEISLSGVLFLKRTMDLVGSAIGLIALSPLFLVFAAAIVIEDRFPVFYIQTRVGQDGREFPFYKFRSMFRNADQIKENLIEENESDEGVIFKMKKDPRVTRVGRFIRRFSIDELPQLLNVLVGDLSIVGPRPPLPKEVAEYTLEDRKRLHVKPGLTCLWQIKGRSDIPFSQQVQLDLEYINSQTIWDDIKIILKTVPAVLTGKGAY